MGLPATIHGLLTLKIECTSLRLHSEAQFLPHFQLRLTEQWVRGKRLRTEKGTNRYHRAVMHWLILFEHLLFSRYSTLFVSLFRLLFHAVSSSIIYHLLELSGYKQSETRNLALNIDRPVAEAILGIVTKSGGTGSLVSDAVETLVEHFTIAVLVEATFFTCTEVCRFVSRVWARNL